MKLSLLLTKYIHLLHSQSSQTQCYELTLIMEFRCIRPVSFVNQYKQHFLAAGANEALAFIMESRYRE